MTDARLLAAHLEWEATEPTAADKAFNVVNGDYFRWKYMWPRIAEYFGVEVAPYPGNEQPLAERFKNVGGDWAKIVKKYGLRDFPIAKVAPWWHVDIDFCRSIEWCDGHEPESGTRIPNPSKYLGGIQRSIWPSASRENYPMTRN
jgi:hypothetical protein